MRIDAPTGLAHSPRPEDHQPRCGSCHQWHDGVLRSQRSRRTSSRVIGAWLLERLDAHGGEVLSHVIYAEADAAGIGRRRLADARRRHTDVISQYVKGTRWNTHRWFRLPESSEMERAHAG